MYFQEREYISEDDTEGECLSFFIWGEPGRVVQSVGHLTHKSEVLGSIPSLATYFRFSFC